MRKKLLPPVAKRRDELLHASSSACSILVKLCSLYSTAFPLVSDFPAAVHRELGLSCCLCDHSSEEGLDHGYSAISCRSAGLRKVDSDVQQCTESSIQSTSYVRGSCWLSENLDVTVMLHVEHSLTLWVLRLHLRPQLLVNLGFITFGNTR